MASVPSSRRPVAGLMEISATLPLNAPAASTQCMDGNFQEKA